MHGSPGFADDESLACPVATFDGIDDAYAYDLSDQWDDLTDGFTLECAFRYEGEDPHTGDHLPCSARWGGGFTVYLNNGFVGFQIHNGGYVAANTRFEVGQWYHLPGVFDGDTVTLYLDGGEVAQKAAPGPMVLPNDPATYRFVVGGGPSTGPGSSPSGYNAASSSSSASRPSAPRDSAAMCHALRSNASPRAWRARSRPASHARSPNL